MGRVRRGSEHRSREISVAPTCISGWLQLGENAYPVAKQPMAPKPNCRGLMEFPMTRTRTLIPVVLVLATLLIVPGASALDKCKAKTDSKDGTILISAADVDGTLKWGGTASGATNPFFNPACVTANTAKGCVLGDVGSEARITPPRQCTIYLADDTGNCSVFLKGCTPTAQGFITAPSTGSVLCPASSTCSGQIVEECPGNSAAASIVRCEPQLPAGVNVVSTDPVFGATVACDVTLNNTNGSPVQVDVNIEALCIPAAD